MNSSPPILFDLAALRAHRARAERLGAVTFLYDRVVDDCTERLGAVLRTFTAAASIGPTKPTLPPLAIAKHVDLLAQDSEALSLDEGAFDLVVSLLTLQSVNDLPGVIAQIRRALKPDGLFLAALLGGDTLAELRQSFAAAEAEIEGGVSPRVAPFADVRELGALLQRAGLALPVADVDRVVVRYDNAFALMQDLRRMGAANALHERRKAFTRRSTLLRMAQIYAERFADADGRIRATFDIVWLSGWAPHASQQQPLKPGSAKMRLEDAVRGSLPSPGGGGSTRMK